MSTSVSLDIRDIFKRMSPKCRDELKKVIKELISEQIADTLLSGEGS